jgi:hypothetical protein
MSDAVYLWCGRCGQAIEPPTGEALREVLLGMHTIPARRHRCADLEVVEVVTAKHTPFNTTSKNPRRSRL